MGNNLTAEQEKEALIEYHKECYGQAKKHINGYLMPQQQESFEYEKKYQEKELEKAIKHLDVYCRAEKEAEPHKKCQEKAHKLLDEYWSSKDIPIKDLCNRPENYLKRGDIINRKLTPGDNSRSGSYAGNSGSGIFIHYAIYSRYLGDDLHEIVEKSEKSGGRTIFLTKVSSKELLFFWRIVVDPRYEATYEMAIFLYNNHDLDSGYSTSHSNCEHFVTFCLTRHNFCSRSRQAGVATLVRDFGALVSVPVTNAVKLVTHPFYKIGGDMSLSGRLTKTSIPFGLDDEAIGSGKKIIIGFSARSLPHSWCPHDENPSRKQLLKCVEFN